MFVAVLAIFFISGFSSLAYQVVWVKLLSHTFGVTSYAVTTVLAAYMGGMALGSYLGGRAAERRVNGVRLFGWLQIALGLYALWLPALFANLPYVYQKIYPALENSPALLTLARFGLSFLLLASPTTLMGAVFPILVRALTEQREDLGPKLARLYTWNTLGSVIGCIATGYALISILGVTSTVTLATGLNILAGVLALIVARALPLPSRPAPEPASRSSQASSVSGVGRAALAVMFFSGFAALGYEVVWTRILSLISDHGIYTFSAIVAVVLIGIALGSLWAASPAAQGARALPALLMVQIGIALCALAWFPAVVGAAQLIVGATGIQSDGRAFFGAALLITLAPCLLMGASFPLAAQVYARESERTGQRVGEAGSINVLGAMLGSLAAGFVLIPWVGAQRSLWVLGLFNLAAALWLAGAARRKIGQAVSLAAVALAAALLAFMPATLYQALFTSLYPAFRVERLIESVEGTVTVANLQDARYIFTNGVHDADTTAAMQSLHRLIGYLPMFIRSAPARPLVIGLGGGATSSAVVQQATGKVEIVELSDGMVAAARMFSDANWQVLDNPRTQLVVSDGRNYVLLADERYDFIAADTIYPMQAYSSNLYSLDYYRMLSARLTDNGITLQWIDSALHEHEQRILMRTFAQAFPHVLLWKAEGLQLLLGSNAPMQPDLAVISRTFTPEVAEALAPMNLNSPQDILAGFTLADDDLRASLGAGLVISDDHPYNEYFRLLRLRNLWRWLERQPFALTASP